MEEKIKITLEYFKETFLVVIDFSKELRRALQPGSEPGCVRLA